jgi:two-component system nitrate/nitrite response regulator NarL
LKARERRLTTQELEMVSAVAMGCTNRDMAREFSLGEDAVECVLVQLFDELGVVSRFELVIHALGHGLLEGGVRARATGSQLPSS